MYIVIEPNTCNPECTLFPHFGLFSLRRVLAKEVLTRHPYSINKKKGSLLYDSISLLLVNSFKFPTLTPSKRPGSNTLYFWLIRLSSPPLPQVSGLGRTPFTHDPFV